MRGGRRFGRLFILRSRNILLKFRTNFSVGFTCTVRLDVSTLYSSPNFHDPCLPEARAAPLLDYATRPLDSARELLIHNHHLVMASARPRCSGWRGARPCRSLLPCATVRYCARTPHPLRASTRRAYASTAHSTRRAFSSTTRREAAPRRRPHRPHRRAVRARVDNYSNAVGLTHLLALALVHLRIHTEGREKGTERT